MRGQKNRKRERSHSVLCGMGAHDDASLDGSWHASVGEVGSDLSHMIGRRSEARIDGLRAQTWQRRRSRCWPMARSDAEHNATLATFYAIFGAYPFVVNARGWSRSPAVAGRGERSRRLLL